MEPEPAYKWTELVMLARPVLFVQRTQFDRRTKRFPQGSVVIIDKPEAYYDDHGRFGRFVYHVYQQDGWWRWWAIAEEDDLTRPNVLDRLANI